MPNDAHFSDRNFGVVPRAFLGAEHTTARATADRLRMARPRRARSRGRGAGTAQSGHIRASEQLDEGARRREAVRPAALLQKITVECLSGPPRHSAAWERFHLLNPSFSLVLHSRRCLTPRAAASHVGSGGCFELQGLAIWRGRGASGLRRPRAQLDSSAIGLASAPAQRPSRRETYHSTAARICMLPGAVIWVGDAAK